MMDKSSCPLDILCFSPMPRAHGMHTGCTRETRDLLDRGADIAYIGLSWRFHA